MPDPLTVLKTVIEWLETSNTPTIARTSIVKTRAEQRYTLGVAYPADEAPGMGADGYNDLITATELERTAWAWMRKSRQLGLMHEDGTEGAGEVVESYIYRGPEWDLGDGQIVKAGDWLIGAVWDEPTWELIKAGELTGLSPQGTATRVPTPNDLPRRR